MKIRPLEISLAVSLLLFAVSCGTTRVLEDGEYRLAKNKVTVVGDSRYPNKDIEKYIRQKSNSSILFGWNPFLNLYNLSRSDKGLWSKVIHGIGTAPVIYDASLTYASIENIGTHLEYVGLYGSSVQALETFRRKKVKVEYQVTLGERIPISSISYVLPEDADFSADFMADTTNITVGAGDWLSEESLEAETVRGEAHFRNLGYYGFTKSNYFFEADTISTPGTAALELRINEYTRNETADDARSIRKYRFGEVAYSYPKTLKFRSKVLRGLNSVQPGEFYSESAVSNTYDRLTALRVFNSVGMELTARDSSIVDCEVNLTPGRLQGLKLGIEGSTNSSGLLGISPEVSYNHNNIFRGGEWLTLSFMGNFQFKPDSDTKATEFGVSLGLSLPRFLGLDMKKHFPGSVPRTEFKVSYNYQDRPEYLRNILAFSYSYSGNSGRLLYQFTPARLDIVRLHNMDQDFYESLSDNPFLRNAYQNHFDLGSSISLAWSDKTLTNPLGSYWTARLGIDFSGNLLSLFKGAMEKDDDGAGMLWGTPYSQYVRAEASIVRSWGFGRNEGQAIAVRLLAGGGYAYGNSSSMPFEQHFYAGGASSLRGWQVRSVGPGLSKIDESFVIPNQTGDIKLEANVEYRFDMFWKLDGAVFVDTGNVWTYKNDSSSSEDSSSLLRWDTLIESIAGNWGVGMRLNFSFLLLRLDLGMIVHDPSQDSGNRWRGPSEWLSKDGYAVHFGVGYPF